MQTNNKQREALEALIAYWDWNGYDATRELQLKDKARAALSEPPRNCEVGKAKEQLARFIAFCKGQRLHSSGHADTCNPKCPCLDGGDVNLCALAWAQMPYEEGGAE